MGARRLCQDWNVQPVRGQVIRVKAPWIKFCVYADNDTYVIPGNFMLFKYFNTFQYCFSVHSGRDQIISQLCCPRFCHTILELGW